MNFHGNKILVTGAGGFIGSHLIEKLVHMGADVHAFIRYTSYNHRGYISLLSEDIQSHITIITGDLKDSESVRAAVKGMDVVFHLGALIAIPYSYQNPLDVVQTNVLGTLHVAQAVREYGVSRMIHTSTSEVYGSARYVPMCEKHPLQGQSPYSASKIAADKLVESFCCSYQLPAVTVRPFNSYGPRQTMRAVIPTIIHQALYSDEIRLGNTDTTRDFTYVTDTAQAFIQAAQMDQALGDVFNAGSGFEIAIGEIVDKVNQLVGRGLPIVIERKRIRPIHSEVDRLFSDSTKAKDILDFKPAVSFDEGLAKTIDWIKYNPARNRPSEYVV